MNWIYCVACGVYDRAMYMPRVWVGKGICQSCATTVLKTNKED